MWSASWLLLVTGNSSYSQYAEMNIEHIKEDGKEHLFNWNDKTLGIKVLLAKLFISYFNFHLTCEGIVAYQSFLLLFLAVILAKYFCSFPSITLGYLGFSYYDWFYQNNDTNMQSVASTAFLILTYANYLQSTNTLMFCGIIVVRTDELIRLARTQVFS